MTATKHEVKAFLDQFKAKARIMDPITKRRDKNDSTLNTLEISPRERIDFLLQLTVADYYKGPSKDELNKESDLWEFGLGIQGREVYIKISVGIYGGPPICHSFHFAERPMHYPFEK